VQRGVEPGPGQEAAVDEGRVVGDVERHEAREQEGQDRDESQRAQDGPEDAERRALVADAQLAADEGAQDFAPLCQAHARAEAPGAGSGSVRPTRQTDHDERRNSTGPARYPSSSNATRDAG